MRVRDTARGRAGSARGAHSSLQSGLLTPSLYLTGCVTSPAGVTSSRRDPLHQVERGRSVGDPGLSGALVVRVTFREAAALDDLVLERHSRAQLGLGFIGSLAPGLPLIVQGTFSEHLLVPGLVAGGQVGEK